MVGKGLYDPRANDEAHLILCNAVIPLYRHHFLFVVQQPFGGEKMGRVAR